MGANSNVTIVLVLLLQLFAFTSAQKATSSGSSKWLTLDGSPPLVIARGGVSGLFPDSSSYAYLMAKMTSVPDLVLWCDVQLTKDGVGICFPGKLLNNGSDIAYVYPSRENSYLVDGINTQGYFSIDFTLKELANVSLTQELGMRPYYFNDSQLQILTVEDVFNQNKPAGFWLNIQDDAFYSQHKLSMRSFVISASKNVIISHISSPDISFLQGLARPFAPTKTKMIFRFLDDQDVEEPSTNQTYGSLLKNLTYIKSFASGILVPKSYIWPVDAKLYLQPHTSLVVDAHKNGIKVFVQGFTNDHVIAYDYSYDPVAEYLSFIDNVDFSVDGVVSDFPITASEARDCFAHVSSNASAQANPLVISHFGASGDYPGCTDISYTAAIQDGADIIDCPVQMSKDGVPFCLSSMNLMDTTLVDETRFRNVTSTVNPVFSYELNWADIKGLTPVISTPLPQLPLSGLFKNPKFKNAGNLILLSEFLTLAKNASSISGVLIEIKNARRYLAANQSLSIIDAVLYALEEGGYNSPKAKKVMIKSNDSAVLKALKGKTYELVYELDEMISDTSNASIADIKTFSDSVVVIKESVYQSDDQGFLLDLSDVVSHLHSFNLPVYVQVLRNVFLEIRYDFFREPIVQINSYVKGAGVDGLITEYPKTVAAYKKNLCLSMKNTPIYMSPVKPGQLITLVAPSLMPPAEAPYPILTVANVSEAPLPSVSQNSSSPPTETPKSSPNGKQQMTASALLSCLTIIVALSLLL